MPGTKQRTIKRPKRFPRGKRRKKDPASPIRSAATSFTASPITDFRHNKETAFARKLSKSPFWNIVSEFDSSISDLHGSSSGDELRDSSDSADSDGENSWCGWQRTKANKERYHHTKAPIPPAIVTLLKPIYARLGSRALLEK